MATAVFKVNYEGLRKRESYNEIVDYLENKQEKINYPNRFAKQIRNSPQLSNLLDGEGMGAVEMEKQQLKAMEHEQAEQAVRQAGGTAQVLRATGRTSNTQDFSIADDNIDNTTAQMRDDIETVKEEEERKEEQKKSDVLEQQQQKLAESVAKNYVSQLIRATTQEGGASSSSQPAEIDPGSTDTGEQGSAKVPRNQQGDIGGHQSKKRGRPKPKQKELPEEASSSTETPEQTSAIIPPSSHNINSLRKMFDSAKNQKLINNKIISEYEDLLMKYYGEKGKDRDETLKKIRFLYKKNLYDLHKAGEISI